MSPSEKHDRIVRDLTVYNYGAATLGIMLVIWVIAGFAIFGTLKSEKKAESAKLLDRGCYVWSDGHKTCRAVP